MQNIIQGRFNFLSIFLFSVSSVLPMEPDNLKKKSLDVKKTSSQQPSFMPDNTLDIWGERFSKGLEKRRPFSDLLPGTLVITPDERGIVVGYKGAVYHYDLKHLGGVKERLLFEHPCVKYSPMIEVGSLMRREKKELFVVSAGNYKDIEDNHVSEYILFCNDLSKVKKLN